MPTFIQRLDHVQVAIPHGGEDLARRFYVDLLGFVEEQKPPPLNLRGGCWLRSGACIVHLGVDPNFIPAKKAHLALVVDDFTTLGALLRSSGFAFDIDHELEHVVRAFTEDPFGNRLELIAS